jgi:hypothetical protein
MRIRLFFLGLLTSLLSPGAADAARSPDSPDALPPATSAPRDPDPGPDAADPATADDPDPGRATAPHLPGVRALLDASRAAGAPGFTLSTWDEALLGAYAEEVTQALGPDAGLPLAGLIASLPAAERTWVVATWALSGHDLLRLALAQAAAHPLDALGLLSALRNLAQDPNPEIRAAARAALAQRTSRVSSAT